MELFELEGTLTGQLGQHPHNEQGHLQPDQVAQSLVQPGLGCAMRDHSLSGQPASVLHCPHCHKLLPDIQSQSPLFEFETNSPFPVTTDPAKESVRCFR